MKIYLKDLVDNLNSVKCYNFTDESDISIKDVSINSKTIKEGDLFIAIKGYKYNAVKFIKDAVNSGAVAIFVDAEALDDISNEDLDFLSQKNIPVFFFEKIREVVSIVANIIYPKKPKNISCITGTNGKTSSTDFVRQFFGMFNFKAASVGSVGIRTENLKIDENDIPDLDNERSSQDAIINHKILEGLQKNNIEQCLIEATSNGLDQYRLDNIDVKVAGITNITPDHLDYHKTFKHYSDAKKVLFSRILKKDGYAILNADDKCFDEFKDVCEKRGVKVISYGYAGKDLKLLDFILSDKGYKVNVNLFGRNYEFDLNVIGEFHIHNVLCSIGVFLASLEKFDINKIDYNLIDKLVGCIDKLKCADGRVEYICENKNGAKVFIDYAHEGAGLEAVLTSLRPFTKNKLITLFGVRPGKSLDRLKGLGLISKKYADVTILTDDNPKDNNPKELRSKLLKFNPDAIEIKDGRKSAIEYAVKNSKKGDILVICGRGHENYYMHKDYTEYYLDKDEVLKWI